MTPVIDHSVPFSFANRRQIQRTRPSATESLLLEVDPKKHKAREKRKQRQL
jgi:hypothetical protein